MKEIKKSEEFNIYFNELLNSKISFVLWQVQNNSRIIAHMAFEHYSFENDSLKLKLLEKKSEMIKGLVYFYSPDLSFIFKTELLDITQDIFSLSLPFVIKVLDADEVSDFQDNFELNTLVMDDRTIIKEVTDDLSVENLSHDLDRERIDIEQMVYDSEVEKIRRDHLSGTVDGTDDEGGQLSGDNKTERINVHNKGHSKTDKMRSTLAGKVGSNAKITTSMQGKGKTDHETTKEYTKSLKNSQTKHDQDIFEKELNYISLDEEDQKFADKRDAPRARPQKGKMVRMKKEGLSGEGRVYELFDLSRGGLGVFSLEDKEFDKGDSIEILAFDSNKLDSPMLAIVRSVRAKDESETSFKIGMQFIL